MKKPKAVGKRVRERRLELGLSQRAIDEKGTSYAYISLSRPADAARPSKR